MSSSMTVLDGVVRVHVDLEVDGPRPTWGGSLLLRALEVHPAEEVGDRAGGKVLHRSLTAHQLHPGSGRVTLLLDEPAHAAGSPDDALQGTHELRHVLVAGGLAGHLDRVRLLVELGEPDLLRNRRCEG